MYSWLGGGSVHPSLIDPVNLKQYSVVKANGMYQQSQDLEVDLTVGQASYFYAYVAAPPAEVKAVDVTLDSGVPVLKSVPVS